MKDALIIAWAHIRKFYPVLWVTWCAMFLGAAAVNRHWPSIVIQFAGLMFWWWVILDRDRTRRSYAVIPYKTWDGAVEEWVDIRPGDFETKRTIAIIERVS